ncbi:hypothetical protein [Delftia acidovorans]|uniref:hypothetical protein n=1 Tax=Delftia acidovorans TaxID=80866 RepID=UPI0028B1B21A|nr:hypothetical protein [Delftia acidovorans]
MINKQAFINIYDEFRDVELNKEYYAKRMESVRRKLRAMDIFLAIFAGGSAVLGFAFWKYTIFGIDVGPILFAFVTGIAAVVGIARPYLKMEDELERISGIQSSYAGISHKLKDVVLHLKTTKNVDPNSQAVYEAMRHIRGTLEAREDKPAKTVIVKEMEEVIKNRYPITYFWYPID